MTSVGTIQTLFTILFFGFVGWEFEIVNSAVIVQNGNQASPLLYNNQSDDINLNIRLFQDVVGNYEEISNAYNSPAKDEAVREKRTLGVLRNIANRTRSGFAALRNLFTGGLNGSEGGGGGFRTFFSNLLNRVLIFLTNLWDRITGFFRRDGSSGGGLFSRLGKLFRGSSGGGGGLFSIFRPTTTTESFLDSDFNYYSSSTTSTENPDDVNAHDGNNNAIDETKQKKPKGKSMDDKENVASDADAGSSGDEFIPFPGDSDLNTRVGRKLETGSENPVVLEVKADETNSSPHVVKSPSIIHLLDDGRRFGF